MLYNLIEKCQFYCSKNFVNTIRQAKISIIIWILDIRLEFNKILFIFLDN